ncbi:hypothetical protein HY090_02435 [Candidatus Kaiserbacteria bacterium]|nr:hypothetical protein [Candidatus Kaiserbacteria bacterium]
MTEEYKKPASIANIERATNVARRHMTKIAAGHKETLWSKFKVRFAAFDIGANTIIADRENMLRNYKAIDKDTMGVIRDLTEKYKLPFRAGILLSFLNASILNALSAPRIIGWQMKEAFKNFQ